MTWQHALEIVVANTGHERYRWLCSDRNSLPAPNGPEAYRALMVEMASSDYTAQKWKRPPVNTSGLTPTPDQWAAWQCCGGQFIPT